MLPDYDNSTARLIAELPNPTPFAGLEPLIAAPVHLNVQVEDFFS